MTSDTIFKKSAKLEIEQRLVGSSTRLREISDWTVWRDRPTSKRKTTRLSSALRKDYDGNVGLKPYQGRTAVRRGQIEQFESNRRENRTTRKEGGVIRRRYKHSFRKRSGGTPVHYSGRTA
jgi:hypothetical protein